MRNYGSMSIGRPAAKSGNAAGETAEREPSASDFKFSDEEIRELVTKRAERKAKEKAFRQSPEGKLRNERARKRTKARNEAIKKHAKKLGL